MKMYYPTYDLIFRLVQVITIPSVKLVRKLEWKKIFILNNIMMALWLLVISENSMSTKYLVFDEPVKALANIRSAGY